MVRRWVCGVVVVALVLGTQGWVAAAKEQQPSDYYFAEFVLAEFGAVVGGAVGFTAVLIYREAHVDSPTRALPIWSVGMGRALGAGLGVTLAGESKGVQGNVFMAYFLPGVLLSIYPIALLVYPDLEPFKSLDPFNSLVFPHLPFMPAMLAVIGFNIGAKMKDTGQPASLPWTLDLPVLSLEF